MSTWYQTTIKYGTYVEGKHKIVSEQYLFRCISLTDLEATVIETLQGRIKEPDVDSFSKPRPSDVYKMTDGPISEIEGDFYVVKVLCDFGDESKTVDKHIVNADSPTQAEKRVRKRLKDVLYDYEITHCDKTKILGVYDKDNIVWVEDFRKRMEDLEAAGHTGTGKRKKNKKADPNQTALDLDPKPEQPQSDPNAITAMVIRNNIEEVEAEDLQNGVDPSADTLTPVGQLPKGKRSRTKSLPAPPPDDQETEPDDDDKHLEEYLANA
ncbi:DUF4494 family protein [Spirosoma sordidisoli]|uniref:DUF4494 domain-containing protein n=1 Tax=Spirosoma sordidisoli TaxID=2502893 RepID=A0A4Q2UN44_9BACT|nr:DUF4494 family protein [Spirosoma sordidisoli]RYC70834.1 DUF4494 domain-containing protein [Spirosoma sordidisoli]